MSDQTTNKGAVATSGTRHLRTALILLIVVLAFVASYQIAAAVGRADATTSGAPGGSTALFPALAGDPSQAGSGSAGCACCGNSGTGEPIEGTAIVEDGVQRITVDTSAGYNPNVIKLAAGIPTEITFTQGSGCMAQVMSADLGFFEDLTAGDVTVPLDGLAPGTYGFSCGMEMVFAEIIVE
jgi:hypothetical protein